MTPDAVRLDLCTSAYDDVKAAVLAGMPGAGGGTEPWFNFPYTEAPLPADLRLRWAGLGQGRDGAGRAGQQTEFAH